MIGVAFDGTGLGDGRRRSGAASSSSRTSAASRRLGASAAARAAGRRGGHPRAVAARARRAARRRRAARPARRDVDPSDATRSRALLGAAALPPRATGAGRWFDAVAALLRARARRSATRGRPRSSSRRCAGADDADAPFEFAIDRRRARSRSICGPRSARSRADAAARRRRPRVIAARFHATLAHAIASACRARARSGAPTTVALTGGCFQNRRLARAQRRALLEARRLRGARASARAAERRRARARSGGGRVVPARRRGGDRHVPSASPARSSSVRERDGLRFGKRALRRHHARGLPRVPARRRWSATSCSSTSASRSRRSTRGGGADLGAARRELGELAELDEEAAP